MKIIKNVKVYTANHTFADGTIFIKDDCIFKVDFSCESGDIDIEGEVIDGKESYAVPGLIDMHFHGCKGYDFCDGTMGAIEKIAKYEASIGVTAIAPATMTLPVYELESILHVAASYRENQKTECADLVGINMEGPFISKIKKGAQDERNIIPCNMDICRQFIKASNGLVKVMGIAPEEGDALSFINDIKGDVCVSLAHTNADFDTARAAFEAGASHVVHLYNAMPPFLHRAPGVIGAATDCQHVTAELICDGVHIHPAVVRTTFKMFGEERIILISDSMRATGMKDGTYTLGGLDVNVCGNRATLVSDGAIAGSATTLPDCVRIAVKEMGIPLETAIRCATENPAKKLGIFDKYGSITAGKKANVVLLDSDLSLNKVMKNGEII